MKQCFVCISVRTKEGQARVVETEKRFKDTCPEIMPLLVHYKVERDNSDPRRGCAHSHAAVSKAAHELFDEHAIVTTIMESDAKLYDGAHFKAWRELIIPFAVAHNDEIDVIVGGMSSATFSREKGFTVKTEGGIATCYKLLKVERGSGFFWYAPVSAKGFEAVSEDFKGVEVDIHVLRDPRLNCYVVVPFVATSANGHSDINGCKKNHEKRIECLGRRAQVHCRNPHFVHLFK